MQAVKQLLLMLEVSPGGTAPRGDEAQRILSFFLSSLKNPQLQRPPPVHAMLSFGTLTPHCESSHPPDVPCHHTRDSVQLFGMLKSPLCTVKPGRPSLHLN